MENNSKNNEQEAQTNSVKTSAQVGIPEKKYLSIIESAEYMGVHPNTIRNWIKFDILIAGRVGLRIIRIEKSELDKLLARYKAGQFSKWNISR